MSYVCYFLDPGGELKSKLSREEIATALQSGTGLLWIDYLNPGADDKLFLEEVFKFHSLAIEDFLSPLIHAPKIDDFGDYLFMIFHGIDYEVESDIIDTAELSLFLGRNYVISGHDGVLYSIESIKAQLESASKPMKQGADFLAHALIDALIDNVLPTIDRMTEASADIEDEIVNNPQGTTIQAIMKLKRSTLKIHRVMVPQRDVLYRMSRGDFTLINKRAQIYYRDIYDHIVRISDLNQTTRDMADNALATYMSSISNRQNEVMKLLAIVAAVFLPLALLAGIYGMNFKYMPGTEWHWGFYAVIGVMVVAIAGMIWYFWSNKWISLGTRKVKRIFSLTVNREKLLGYNRKKHNKT